MGRASDRRSSSPCSSNLTVCRRFQLLRRRLLDREPGAVLVVLAQMRDPPVSGRRGHVTVTVSSAERGGSGRRGVVVDFGASAFLGSSLPQPYADTSATPAMGSSGRSYEVQRKPPEWEMLGMTPKAGCSFRITKHYRATRLPVSISTRARASPAEACRRSWREPRGHHPRDGVAGGFARAPAT